jgi:hypothetical protein
MGGSLRQLGVIALAAACAGCGTTTTTGAGGSGPPSQGVRSVDTVHFNTARVKRRPGESAGAWAVDLVTEATEHVRASDPACALGRFIPAPQPVTLSQGSPSAAILDLLAVLRRPATAQELALVKPGMQPGLPGIVTIFGRYTRIVHGPDGLVASITVGVGRESIPASDLPHCQREVDRYLGHLLHGQPRDVQFYAHQLRRTYRLGPLTAGVHPWLGFAAGRTVPAEPGGPFDPRSFRTTGTWEAGLLSPTSSPRSSLVAGLVPDGVASVTLELPPHVSHGRTVFHERYPHPYTATATVVENVIFFPDVPRDPAVAAQSSTMIWRGPSGRVLRVIRQPQ